MFLKMQIFADEDGNDSITVTAVICGRTYTSTAHPKIGKISEDEARFLMVDFQQILAERMATDSAEMIVGSR